MHQYKDGIKKTISAICVALVGVVFIMGLTPKSAHGIGWHWPYTNPEVKDQALPTIHNVHQSEASPQESLSLSGTSLVNARHMAGSGVPVLMYHHVEDLTDQQRQADPIRSDLTVSISDFESQVKFFKDKNYQSINIQQLYDSVSRGKILAKTVVFTFDDGYKDVFTNAIPILHKYGYIGSFAIATDLLGRPTYGTWDDVLQADTMNMEILSHTENHLDLISPKYSESDLEREIIDSKAVLESKLGHSVPFFVYPYGHVDDKVSAIVSRAGYKMAFTTKYGLVTDKNILTEPRVRVHGVDGLAKLLKIRSW